MGSGDKNLLNFHLHVFPHHHHHGGKKEVKDIPKGCLAVTVGQGEEQQRFIIPVIYINHPLFMQLLKEAEEEYGFDQKGPINIPCHVEEFRHIQGLIDKEKSHHHHHHHHHHNHHHHHHLPCFR
ncbi:Auxin-responsive protein saur32, partial [Sarracenia purpurea var. burkii]